MHSNLNCPRRQNSFSNFRDVFFRDMHKEEARKFLSRFFVVERANRRKQLSKFSRVLVPRVVICVTIAT